MFSVNSNIKIGYRVEKAYDLMDCNLPFTMSLISDVDNAVTIVTDCGELIVSDDTYVLTARGNWKPVDKLQQGELLKTISCNAKILKLVPSNKPIDMFYVTNTDSVTVNGFMIDG